MNCPLTHKQAQYYFLKKESSFNISANILIYTSAYIRAAVLKYAAAHWLCTKTDEGERDGEGGVK